MEQLIAKLLESFEQGKMTRRQLIQSLAMTATVAAAGALASPVAAADEKGFKAIAVNHISHESPDYGKVRDFYRDLLGMKVTKDDGRQAYLAFGDSFLIARHGPTRAARIDHIAYTIDEWNREAVGAELKRRGLQPRPDTENSFHVTDPAGFDLQIAGKGMKF
jgi:catechol 2,3-dioxygenase-like lactoylglutathione lyase family enzyme